ncbi:apolipoprotein N-acyltransferase [Breznakiella homolactica]|uniref:Apolipoprotein N-acyltransferase n=1 Tax=Breznakiella homolactica TaxID=2798577 RepID=A0A7T8B9I7_9SPIR|nr:apolipoprotein N-acyltransferase [Breznakiella homolactica]QQO08000.1 apolipoprotein N-acyltransferase [Breznakiella homolactica]
MKYCAAIVSGLFLAMAVPNEGALYGSVLLGFFCLAPYFAALRLSRSYGEAALMGFMFGAVSHTASSYWLVFFEGYAIWTVGATALVYGIAHAAVAGFLRFVSADRIGGNRAVAPGVRSFRPLLTAAVWTVWEWLKSVGFLGFPWGLVAYALNNRPRMIQIADITGVYGLSFILALSSAVIAEAVFCVPGLRFVKNGKSLRVRGISRLNPALPGAAVFAGLLAMTLIYGVYRLSRPTPVCGHVPLLLVQHNADSRNRSELNVLGEAVRLSREGTEQFRNYSDYPRPALIVWSESVLRRPFEEYRSYYVKNPPDNPLLPFLAETGIPLLTGAPVVHNWERYEASNSAVLISPDGGILFSYAKQHPVPFAEAVPFIEYPWMKRFMRDIVGFDGSWTMGTEYVVMELPRGDGKTLRFGTPICFEDAFAGLCGTFFERGADILINLTNDSWSRRKSAETQHFAAARFRAVENRRVLVRSANSGVTAVIDAEGGILGMLPLFESGFLAMDVPVQISGNPTVYAVLGDWLPALCALGLFGYIVLSLAGQKRRPRR